MKNGRVLVVEDEAKARQIANYRLEQKKTKQKGIIWLFSKKTVWSKENWGEDSENLKKYYMNRGYRDIIVGEPKVGSAAMVSCLKYADGTLVATRIEVRVIPTIG